MGDCKDLSEFDKGQIVMTRRLDQSISKTAALLQKTMHRATKQKWFRNGSTTSLRCGLGLQIPQISIQSSICGMCWTNKSDPCNFENLKDLLLKSWCQIPQHTFRDLVESMPRRVRAVLAAKVGPIQY
ncbi:hypothetical protein QTP70_028535 [Hemibagrus guttatus]|uniref:Uncharacterized protein n=1 Tax=Hemibagrus guttatus TaxID=175788 RepID=A0AAE0US78_9TELE|nr:hypothetical protein QTP70_028535 [Hemibagrus guttatus]